MKDLHALIVQAISLGHDFDTACLLAGVDIDDIDALAEDSSLMKRVAIAEASLVNDLLLDFSRGNAKALSKGNTAGTQWMLGKINPQRFGSSTKVSVSPDSELPARIMLGRGKTESEE